MAQQVSHIGFAGLGNMGQPMARNLLKAGLAVAVWNRSRGRADALAADGARIAETPAELVPADIVVTMLADDDAVQTVVRDARLIDRLGKGSIHVSMSTIGVALARTLAADHAARGQFFVSAPVFGRPEAAAAAKLFIVAAGPRHAVDRCQPLFDAMGQRTFHFGERPEAANVIKLSGNFLIASVIESLGEAVALTRKHGVEPHAYVEFLTETLFAAPIYRTHRGIIADERYRPAGFRMPLGLKDVSLALEAAKAAVVPLPVASLIRDHMIAALAQGYGDADWSALGQIAARNAGL